MKKIFIGILLSVFYLNAYAQQTKFPSDITATQATIDSLARLDASGNLKGSGVNGWAAPAVQNVASPQRTLTTTLAAGLLTEATSTDSVVVFDAITKTYKKKVVSSFGSSTVQTLTDAATITWNASLGSIANVSINTVDPTLANITNAVDGQLYILNLKNIGAARYMFFGSKYRYQNSGAFATASGVSISGGSLTLLITYDATNDVFVVANSLTSTNLISYGVSTGGSITLDAGMAINYIGTNPTTGTTTATIAAPSAKFYTGLDGRFKTVYLTLKANNVNLTYTLDPYWKDETGLAAYGNVVIPANTQKTLLFYCYSAQAQNVKLIETTTSQSLSATGTALNWNSVVTVGNASANVTTLPVITANDIGKTITIKNVNNGINTQLPGAGATMIGGISLKNGESVTFVAYDLTTIQAISDKLNAVTSSVQNVNITGNITSWNSKVYVDATAGNIVVTLPSTIGQDGSDISIIRTDATTNTVTLAPFAGQTLSLLSSGTEIYQSKGALTVTASGTVSTQKSNIGTAPVIGDVASVVQFSAGVNTNLTTVTSTNGTTSGTLLSTTSRVPLTGATVSGGLVVNAANGTIAISKAGTYSVNVVMNIQSAGANGQWGQLVKNNTTLLTTSHAYSQASGAAMQVIFNYTGLFAVGDLIDVRLSASSAGTIGITGYSYSIVQESGFLPIDVSKISASQQNFRVTTNNVTTLLGAQTVLAVTNLNTDINGGNTLVTYNGTNIVVTAGTYPVRLEYFLKTLGSSAHSGTFFFRNTLDAIGVKLGDGLASGTLSTIGTYGQNSASTPAIAIIPSNTTITLNIVYNASANNQLVQVGTYLDAREVRNTSQNTAIIENVMLNIADLPTGGAIIAGTVDPYVIGYNVAQTTANQVMSLPNPTTTTVNRIIYVNNTGSVSFQLGGITVNALQSQAYIWNGTAWSIFSNNTNQNVLSESGANLTITNGATFTGAIPTTITGSTFILPSAGKWLVNYNVTAAQNTAGQGIGVGIYNSLNVVVNNSLSYYEGISTAGAEIPMPGTAFITTTGAETFTLKGTTTSGIATITNNTLTNNGGQSSITWNKIGGFLPIIGNATNYWQGQATAPTVATGTTDVTAYTKRNGNLSDPVAGVYTISQAGTYRIRAAGQVSAIANGSTFQLAWTDNAGVTLTTNSSVQGTVGAVGNTLMLQSEAIATITVSAPTTFKLRSITNTITSTFVTPIVITIDQIGLTGVTSFANLVPNDASGNTVQVDQTKSVLIGTSTAVGKLTVDAGVTTNTTIQSNSGSINDFLQFDIKNTSTGTGAQSGYSATANDGTSTTKFVWMGKNNSLFNNPQTYNVGAANDGTFMNDGGNMWLHNSGLTGRMAFSTGSATTPFYTERMSILNSNGNVGIGTINPLSTLENQGSLGGKSVDITAATYTALVNDYHIRLSGALNQTLTLPAAATATNRIYKISNPTGYLKVISSVRNLNQIAETQINSHETFEVMSDGTNWNKISSSGDFSDNGTRLFTAGAFLTGSLIVGGVEFSIVGANTTGANTFVQARLVGLPASRNITGLIQRASYAAVPVLTGELINPTLTTTYTALNTIATPLNANYLTISYRINDRVTGEIWDCILNNDGTVNALLTVKYTSPN